MRKKLLFVAIAVLAPVAHAGLYKCQDASGALSYQEMPCASGAKAVKSEVAERSRVKSNMPCNMQNVAEADRRLAVYMLRSASRSYYSMRSGGSLNYEVGEFRRASVEAGHIPVPECMERGREVTQKYLEFIADRLLAKAQRHSYESADTRAEDLRSEYRSAIEEAKRQARQTDAHVWAPKDK